MWTFTLVLLYAILSSFLPTFSGFIDIGLDNAKLAQKAEALCQVGLTKQSQFLWSDLHTSLGWPQHSVQYSWEITIFL